MKSLDFKCILIGASAGGLPAIETLISSLDNDFSLPIIIVQHLPENASFNTPEILKKFTSNKVVAAVDKRNIDNYTIYIAPPGYHTLIDSPANLSLSIDPPINFSRPSIDALFTSASDVFGHQLIAIILTGANNDGTEGISEIHKKGGTTIVQTPKEASSKTMPVSAIKSKSVDYIFNLNEIAKYLNTINNSMEKTHVC